MTNLQVLFVLEKLDNGMITVLGPETKILTAFNQIRSIINKESPAAARAVLDKDPTLIPKIIASLSLIDNKIKTFDSKLFRSNGKLKSGEEAIHSQVL